MPTRIVTLGSDVTIAILLHKTAVALVVHIGSFKTVAVLILLDGRTITLTVLILALKLRAVGKAHDTLAVGLAVLKHTLYSVAALLRQFATTILLISFPLTHIKMPEPVRAPRT